MDRPNCPTEDKHLGTADHCSLLSAPALPETPDRNLLTVYCLLIEDHACLYLCTCAALMAEPRVKNRSLYSVQETAFTHALQKLLVALCEN